MHEIIRVAEQRLKAIRALFPDIFWINERPNLSHLSTLKCVCNITYLSDHADIGLQENIRVGCRIISALTTRATREDLSVAC